MAKRYLVTAYASSDAVQHPHQPGAFILYDFIARALNYPAMVCMAAKDYKQAVELGQEILRSCPHHQVVISEEVSLVTYPEFPDPIVKKYTDKGELLPE